MFFDGLINRIVYGNMKNRLSSSEWSVNMAKIFNTTGLCVPAEHYMVKQQH